VTYEREIISVISLHETGGPYSEGKIPAHRLHKYLKKSWMSSLTGVDFYTGSATPASQHNPLSPLTTQSAIEILGSKLGSKRKAVLRSEADY
jgi:hypothetical protein